MTETIRFFLFDIYYNNNITLFGRTEDGKRICVIDKTFNSYFYVIPEKEINLNNYIKKLKTIQTTKNKETGKIIQAELQNKQYEGKDIQAIKITIDNPKLIQEISREVKELSETQTRKEVDIPTHKKYLIQRQITPLTLCEVTGEKSDEKIKADIVIEGSVKQLTPDIYQNPKTLSIDIEVYGLYGGAEKAETDPIIMIAFKGSDGFEKVITWKKFKDPQPYVEFVNSEADLIQKTVETIKHYSPDYLVGYNSDSFDLKYIHERAKVHKIKLDLSLDYTNLEIGRGNSKAKIKGIPHIDIFQFIRKIMSGFLQLESYSLNAVAKEMLDKTKKPIDIENISELWDKGDIKNMCEYNLYDTDLTLQLFQKIYPNMVELTKLISIPIYEITRASYGQLTENYLIKKANQYNQLIPNKPTPDIIYIRRAQTYQGAFVMEPTPGFYKNIAMLDFRSLYPSIIVTKNIDPYSLNHKEGIKTPEIKEKTHYYFSKKPAFIPQTIKEILEKRKKIKEIIKQQENKNPSLEARSYALKTVANSTYGYLGFFGARWYSLECVASITAFAREYIKDVIKKAQKSGFNPIYSDTDSIALTYENKTQEDVLKFLEKINKSLTGVMELELENFYTYGIFVAKKGESEGAKKKYALIDKKDNMKIIGFETIRRDWSSIARQTQFKVLEIILKEHNFPKALEYTKNIIRKIKNKEIPIKDLIIKTQLQKNIQEYKQIGPHVKVAKEMQTLGYNIKAGTNIMYVITEGKGIIRDKAKLPKECKEGSYDSDYYINNQIIPSIERIFNAIGFEKEDLIKDKQQSSLIDF